LTNKSEKIKVGKNDQKEEERRLLSPIRKINGLV